MNTQSPPRPHQKSTQKSTPKAAQKTMAGPGAVKKAGSNPGRRYWLMKSEPSVYSIYHLQKSGADLWDGVRNYQARNFMKHRMQPGDEVLFYHSNAKPPGIAGLAQVKSPAQADPTAFDPRSQYYDPKSNPQNPRWFCVTVAFKAVFKNLIPLPELKKHKALAQMLVLKKGQRLSILPVTKKEYQYIIALAQKSGSYLQKT